MRLSPRAVTIEPQIRAASLVLAPAQTPYPASLSERLCREAEVARVQNLVARGFKGAKLAGIGIVWLKGSIFLRPVEMLEIKKRDDFSVFDLA